MIGSVKMIETDFYKSLSDEDRKEVINFYNMLKNNEFDSLTEYMNNLEMINLVSNFIKELGNNV
jgi:hypothetical protein